MARTTNDAEQFEDLKLFQGSFRLDEHLLSFKKNWSGKKNWIKKLVSMHVHI